MAGLRLRSPRAVHARMVETVIVRIHPIVPAAIVSVLLWTLIIAGVAVLVDHYGDKKMEYIGAHERMAYTVEHRDNCILVTGPVPLSAMGALAQMVPEGSVLDNELGRTLGATFALGLPEDLIKLRRAHSKPN